VSAYSLQWRWGDGEASPGVEKMRQALAELDTDDPEHPDTWLSDENGWTLSVHQGGAVVLENGSTGEGPWHMLNVPRDQALELWVLFAEGRLEAVRSKSWALGRPSVPPEERERRRREAAAATEYAAREFLQSLGPEDPNTRCRTTHCSRGTVRFSIYCRRHHYEMLRGPWPYGEE
jgi:hypothetical protein